MNVTSIKTTVVTVGDDLYRIIDNAVTTLPDKSVLAITSNIISLCEKRVVKIGAQPKIDLIESEADYFLPPENKWQVSLTIKNSVLIPSAGIDESNTDGYYTLWPENPQQTANQVRRYLVNRFKHQSIGVIIVDSKTTPLRWGVTGVAIAHSGFSALNDYSGKPDIFGRLFAFEKANIADALAAAAVAVMGEGNEQTPLALIENIPFVRFQQRDPIDEELAQMSISLEEDLYGQILLSAPWQRKKE